jgi:hypothetical protein
VDAFVGEVVLDNFFEQQMHFADEFLQVIEVKTEVNLEE